MANARTGAVEADGAYSQIPADGYLNGRGDTVAQSGAAVARVEDLFAQYDARTRRERQRLYWTSLAALALGAALILLRYLLAVDVKTVPTALELSRDMGIGLVVGATVGIFYDGMMKVNEKVKNDFVFKESMGRLDDATRQMQAAGDTFNRLESPDITIRRSLDTILPNRKYSDIKNSVLKLVSYLRESRALESSIGSKEVNEYVGLLNWLMNAYVVRAADEFNDIFRGLLGNSEGRAFFKPPDRREVTLQMLSAQMNAMEENDRYDSLTNAWLYKNMPEDYIVASCKALVSGVEIRRIFNICNLETNARENLNEAKAIIQNHIARFSSIPSHRFHCRFLTCSTLANIKPYILEDGKVTRETDVTLLTFGHFHHNSSGSMIRFDPQRPDMSIMKINVYANSADDDDAIAYERLFEHLWDIAELELPA